MRILIACVLLIAAALFAVLLSHHSSNKAPSGNQAAQSSESAASPQTKQLRFSPQIRREDQQMLQETWDELQLIRQEVAQHQNQKH